MKCTDKKFKGQRFYFDYYFSLDKESCTKLSMINNGYNKDLKQPDHDMSLSFKLHCQRYQIYNNRQKDPKPSTVTSDKTSYMYQDEICKQSAVNDRRNFRRNGCSLQRKACFYLPENKKSLM